MEIIVGFLIGIMFILFGVFAIALNKYPHKKRSIKNLERKYGRINEKKLSVFDGLNYFVCGGIYISFGFIIKNKKQILNTWTVLIILLLCLVMSIAYYPIRRKYLGLNKEK